MTNKFDRKALEGMTTRERLFEVGLEDAFEKAIDERDFEKVREILLSVYVDEETTQMSIDRMKQSIIDYGDDAVG
jgi:hypothetical protein